MYLFINTAITNKRLAQNRLVTEDRLDIFKYCISSLSTIPFNEVFIYLHFYDDENIKDRKEEINNHIKESFFYTKVNLYNFRNEYQSQWKEALKPIIDGKYNSVWFMCNDDHIFIESKLDTVLSAKDIIENSSENIAMYLSHWPEMLKMSQKYNNGILYNKYFQFWEGINYDSILYMHKNILFDWWFNHEYGDKFMPRSDWFNGVTVEGPSIKMLTPLREQCRHFEGYPHINIPVDKCPILEIPKNFFDKKIDLKLPQYNIFHKNDIPLFWKNRINTIDSFNINLDNRINHILTVANSRPNEDYIVINNNLIKDAYVI